MGHNDFVGQVFMNYLFTGTVLVDDVDKDDLLTFPDLICDSWTAI